MSTTTTQKILEGFSRYQTKQKIGTGGMATVMFWCPQTGSSKRKIAIINIIIYIIMVYYRCMVFGKALRNLFVEDV